MKPVLVCMMLAAGSAHADKMYKCVDPSTGRVTISQTQCALDAQDIELRGYRLTEAQQQAGRDLARQREYESQQVELKNKASRERLRLRARENSSRVTRGEYRYEYR